MPSGLDLLPLCPDRLTSRPPETTPHAGQSLLANSRRDLFAADSHKESPRSRVVDASIRATLTPSQTGSSYFSRCALKERVQGYFTFSTSPSRKWHTRHCKTIYSQSKWPAKEPNSQHPTDRWEGSTYLHRKGAPLSMVKGCFNESYLLLAARTSLGIRLEDWICSGGGKDIMDCFLCIRTLNCLVCWFTCRNVCLQRPARGVSEFENFRCSSSWSFAALRFSIRCQWGSPMSSLNRSLLSISCMYCRCEVSYLIKSFHVLSEPPAITNFRLLPYSAEKESFNSQCVSVRIILLILN